MIDRLGYTFYPKDFISDPDVMMMDSSERGIYRDLIDLAYMNDNIIKHSIDKLAKYCNCSPKEVQKILELKGKAKGKFWTIPSCEKRIKKAKVNRANGKKGGRPKTQTETQSKTESKPSAKGKEKEKEKEKEKHNIVPYNVFENTLKELADKSKWKIEDEQVFKLWDQLEKREWKAANGQKISNWQSYLKPQLEEMRKIWRFKNDKEYRRKELYGNLAR